MNALSKEQFNDATTEWAARCSDYTAITKLIPSNYVFTFEAEQILWMKKYNKYKDFCTEIGVFQGQLVAVLCPLDDRGQRMVVDQFPYSPLKPLDGDLRLVETEQYTVTKNAILSKDLQRIDDNSDTYLPVTNKPILAQDIAVAAIEEWRDEAMMWFYRECSEFKGSRVFKKFYVPSEDIYPKKDNLKRIICSFGLKNSAVYQRLLPTLIFISFYEELQGNGSASTISNTYDWSQPCPPMCPFN